MKTKRILNIMKVISWIVFIGLSIRAGALLTSSFVSIFINKQAVKNLYLGLDLSRLHEFSTTHYNLLIICMLVLAILKAYIFYLVVKLFAKIDLDNPFTLTTASPITKIGYTSLIIGIISVIAYGYNFWLLNKVVFPVLITEGKSYLFLGGIVLIIAFIFKRGIEIQQENDLTI